jgi:hypothetical protein
MELRLGLLDLTPYREFKNYRFPDDERIKNIIFDENSVWVKGGIKNTIYIINKTHLLRL